jgi:hypothetical protein
MTWWDDMLARENAKPKREDVILQIGREHRFRIDMEEVRAKPIIENNAITVTFWPREPHEAGASVEVLHGEFWHRLPTKPLNAIKPGHWLRINITPKP